MKRLGLISLVIVLLSGLIFMGGECIPQEGCWCEIWPDLIDITQPSNNQTEIATFNITVYNDSDAAINVTMDFEWTEGVPGNVTANVTDDALAVPARSESTVGLPIIAESGAQVGNWTFEVTWSGDGCSCSCDALLWIDPPVQK